MSDKHLSEQRREVLAALSRDANAMVEAWREGRISEAWCCAELDKILTLTHNIRTGVLPPETAGLRS